MSIPPELLREILTHGHHLVDWFERGTEFVKEAWAQHQESVHATSAADEFVRALATPTVDMPCRVSLELPPRWTLLEQSLSGDSVTLVCVEPTAKELPYPGTDVLCAHLVFVGKGLSVTELVEHTKSELSQAKGTVFHWERLPEAGVWAAGQEVGYTVAREEGGSWRRGAQGAMCIAIRADRVALIMLGESSGSERWQQSGVHRLFSRASTSFRK